MSRDNVTLLEPDFLDRLQNYCGDSPFWDNSLAWNNLNGPDLTPCFQESIIVFIPTLYILITAPLQLYNNYRNRKHKCPLARSSLIVWKYTILSALIILNIVELADGIISPKSSPSAVWISPIVTLVGLTLALYIQHKNVAFGTSNSISLFLYWLLYFVKTALNTRSMMAMVFQIYHDPIVFADWLDIWPMGIRFKMRVAILPLALIQLILSCMDDSGKLLNQKTQYHDIDLKDINYQTKPQPNVLSYLTLSWLNNVIRVGYKRDMAGFKAILDSLASKTSVISEEFDQNLSNKIEKVQKLRQSQIAVIRKFHRGHADLKDCQELFIEPEDMELFKRKDISDDEIIHSLIKQQSKPLCVNTMTTFLRLHKVQLITCVLLRIATSLLPLVNPIIINLLLIFLADANEPTWHGYTLIIIVTLTNLLDTFMENHSNILLSNASVKLKMSLLSSIYRKTLRLSGRARQQIESGNLVSMASIQATMITESVSIWGDIITIPIRAITSIYLLYYSFGISVIISLICYCLSVPIIKLLARKIEKNNGSIMTTKILRIDLISEIMNYMKMIKIYAWEKSFIQRVNKIRDVELNLLKRGAKIVTSTIFLETIAADLFMMLIIVTFVYIGDPILHILTPSRMFVAISLSDLLRSSLSLIPILLQNLSNCNVARKNLDKFLEYDEIDLSNIKQIHDPAQHSLRITNGTFSWDSKQKFTLSDINIEVPVGSLIAIVGHVGSGKSTLLSAILGDIKQTRGSIEIDKTTTCSYMPQDAWIINDTVETNITLGKPFQEDKYRQILEACALETDLLTFQNGDQCEIGEKGLNLSGGQKQRISLARAIYSDAHIILLDDPLSAVDTHVGKHIFDEVIGPNGLLANRTRIMVTNKLSILPEVDNIVVLSQGKIIESGCYQDLLIKRGHFSNLYVKHILEARGEEKTNIWSEIGADLKLRESLIEDELKNIKNRSNKKKTLIQKDNNLVEKAKNEPVSFTPQLMNQLNTTKETNDKFIKNSRAHQLLVKNLGYRLIIISIAIIFAIVSSLIVNIWLADWSNDSSDSSLAISPSNRNWRVTIYMLLALMASIFSAIAFHGVQLGCLKLSQNLHQNILHRVMNAPQSWYDQTPVGEILNRFSRDFTLLDTALTLTMAASVNMIIKTIGMIISSSLGSYITFILIVPILIGLFRLHILSLPAALQAKHLEASTSSPVYSQLGETIIGLNSIKALKLDDYFLEKFHGRVDKNNGPSFASKAIAQWRNLRLKVLGTFIVAVVGLVNIILRGYISQGVAGLTFTYSLAMCNWITGTVETYTQYVLNAVSIDRLYEYTNTQVEDENDHKPDDPEWPSRGEIIFDHYSARYRPDLELAIKDISITINPGERVGVLGRTGAGKSSITLSIFRIFEPVSGSIFIDGVNISDVNLTFLRSRLSMIPQNPVMFTGSIRQNIDPFGEYSDLDIWRAVKLAHLGDLISSIPNGLDHMVIKAGSNFSAGQRQLFCFCRALIKKTKILLLDEATAAVDPETDGLIQETIRKEFQDTTILTIAHRVETILDYDRVIIMDKGLIIEEGTPKSLMRNKDSVFYSLASEARPVKNKVAHIHHD